MRELFGLDRASVRAFDEDDRLHVDVASISRACINPYLAEEIPDSGSLGLISGRVYNLLRPPDELARAAPTFNRVPLQLEHKPMTADAHEADLVVGSTGSDVVFNTPFLQCSLVVWDRRGIEAVETGGQKQLSAAYRYRCDLTPGQFEGQAYDGVMRDIRGSHVALVQEGRAGPDCVVGDRAFRLKQNTGEVSMSSQQVIRMVQDIRAAENEVAPIVGDVLGCDSANGVYLAALKRLGHNAEGFRAGGAKQAFRLARGGRPRTLMATDAQRSLRAAMFPNAGRLA